MLHYYSGITTEIIVHLKLLRKTHRIKSNSECMRDAKQSRGYKGNQVNTKNAYKTSEKKGMRWGITLTILSSSFRGVQVSLLVLHSNSSTKIESLENHLN